LGLWYHDFDVKAVASPAQHQELVPAALVQENDNEMEDLPDNFFSQEQAAGNSQALKPLSIAS
jgi:hypothetical protein